MIKFNVLHPDNKIEEQVARFIFVPTTLPDSPEHVIGFLVQKPTNSKVASFVGEFTAKIVNDRLHIEIDSVTVSGVKMPESKLRTYQLLSGQDPVYIIRSLAQTLVHMLLVATDASLQQATCSCCGSSSTLELLHDDVRYRMAEVLRNEITKHLIDLNVLRVVQTA